MKILLYGKLYQHSLTVAAKETFQTQELEGYFLDLGFGAEFGKTKNNLMENGSFSY